VFGETGDKGKPAGTRGREFSSTRMVTGKKRRRIAPPTINLYQPPGLAARLAGRPRIAGLSIGQQA